MDKSITRYVTRTTVIQRLRLAADDLEKIDGDDGLRYIRKLEKAAKAHETRLQKLAALVAKLTRSSLADCNSSNFDLVLDGYVRAMPKPVTCSAGAVDKTL